MPGKPLVTIGSMHICPLCNGTVPHVGGPVTGPGMPGVLISGQPVAVVGDMCTCVGPPDTIIQGEPGVLVNGKPVATIGSMTAHGGQITSGIPGVMISSSSPSSGSKAPLKEIPFPKVTPLDTIGSAITGKSKSQTQAKENIVQNEQEAFEQATIPDLGFSM